MEEQEATPETLDDKVDAPRPTLAGAAFIGTLILTPLASGGVKGFSDARNYDLPCFGDVALLGMPQYYILL